MSIYHVKFDLQAFMALLEQTDNFKVMPATTFTFNLNFPPKCLFWFFATKARNYENCMNCPTGRILNYVVSCVYYCTVPGNFMTFCTVFQESSSEIRVNRLG